MPRIAIVMEVDICRHPNPSLGTEITNEAGLLCCRDCGSHFPSGGRIELWADGIKVSNLKVQR